MDENFTFQHFLKINKNKKIFIDPCSGNNGDLLIWEGMKHLLQQYNINSTPSPESAELIIINGGGMFIDAYKQGINKIVEYSTSYPNTILCIAPSSFYFKYLDFGKVLDIRQKELIIFCRERYSKKYIDDLIKDRNLITSYLDHDLAFNLVKSDFILKNFENIDSSDAKKVLVVDRMDVEHKKNEGNNNLVKKLYILLTPKPIKDFIRKYRFELRNKNGTSMTKQALNYLKKEYPGIKISSVETQDISRVDVCNFEEFIQKIAESEFIFTNRLHVGILGHLLNKNVYLQEGSYHKMKGIYELSMNKKKTTQILI